MFKKLLVANRGEIAIHIMRSAQELGIKTVAVYEETDKTSMHIMRADEAVCIGSGPGGALSLAMEQAEKAGLLERTHELFTELIEVQKELGDIWVVTPGSQILWSTALSTTYQTAATKSPQTTSNGCFSVDTGLFRSTIRLNRFSRR